MNKYDVIVVGSGSGLDIVSYAGEQKMKTALIEEGPMGGTCLNRGCIPSKMLIHSADVAETIKNSQKFGIKSRIDGIDFKSIIKRVSAEVDRDSREIEKAIRASKNVTLYKTRGKFIGEKIIQVGQEQITADKIFIVGGTRPSIPKIEGVNKIKYLTSTEALRLTKQPQHLVVIGGGYIACELVHFFAAVGTKVTMLVRRNALLDNEDSEIAEIFREKFIKKYKVMFNAQVEEFVQKNDDEIGIKLKAGNKILTASHVLFATGRIPNTDILNVKASGIETDEKGYIKVNEYLETNVDGIWAFGDIVGILPFKHTANHQAVYARRNVLSGRHEPVDYHGIAHAVFSSPQVAGVGKTEDELKKERIEYKVGREELKNTAMGAALQENGLVKVLVDAKTDEILGGHIVGPDASTLIHEIVIAMKTTGRVSAISDSVYVHPALSEVVQRAFWDIN